MASAHIDSVIDPAIGEYDSVLYDQLIQMETYTYDNSQQYKDDSETEFAGVAEYQPFWQALNDAFITYQQQISKQRLQEFIIGLYGFLYHFKVNGYGEQSQKNDSHADIVLGIQQFTDLIDSIKSRAVEYYDDYEYSYVNNSNETVPEAAPRLENDTNILTTIWSEELSKIDSLITYYVSISTDASTDAIFGNGSEPLSDFDQQIAWDLVFDTLGWKSAIELLNMDFTVPPRPDKPPQPPSS